ncbi:MAG: hypothetical protein D6772_16200 [Bacteroidetes bacterium]|nr:MAG: hypothetical protein D6772_16200 [Bacteroidota bacterium]
MDAEVPPKCKAGKKGEAYPKVSVAKKDSFNLQKAHRRGYLPAGYLIMLIALGSVWSSLLSCQQQASHAVPLQVSFICAGAGGTLADAKWQPERVFVQVDAFKLKLAEWSDCEVLVQDDFPAVFPPGTQAAARGAGYLLWAVATDTAVDLYTARQADLAAARYNKIATFTNGCFELLRPLHPSDLAGYYTHAGTDTSYVLFVGAQGDHLITKLFASRDALPSAKMLQRALPSFAATAELPLRYDVHTMNFRGPLGQGYLYWRRDTAALCFDVFLGKERSVSFSLVRDY